jgi:hypothetical protein
MLALWMPVPPEEHIMKPAGVCLVLALGLPAGAAVAQMPSSAEQFRAMAAYLKSNKAERDTAIATCIAKGVGDNPAGLAALLKVPVEGAAAAWCTRLTNAIADGRVSFADVSAIGEGKVTDAARAALGAD